MHAAGPRLEVDCGACAKALKCCDFQPFVANFLVGQILAKGENLPSLDPKKALYLPIGVVATNAFRTRHAEVVPEQRQADLACGFYDLESRKCKIWFARPGECSTYFCDSLPRTDLSQNSFEIEVAVAQMALVQQGFSRAEINFQVDAINGERDQTSSPAGLEHVYLTSWKWSQTLKAQDIQSWLK